MAGTNLRKAARYAGKDCDPLHELFPRVGFIVTNLETDSRAVVQFYNKWGTAEQWIKEGKQASCFLRGVPLPWGENAVAM